MLFPLLLSTLSVAAELTPVQQALLAECTDSTPIFLSLGSELALNGTCTTEAGPSGTLVTVSAGDKRTLYFMLEEVQAVHVSKVGKSRMVYVRLD